MRRGTSNLHDDAVYVARDVDREFALRCQAAHKGIALGFERGGSYAQIAALERGRRRLRDGAGRCRTGHRNDRRTRGIPSLRGEEHLECTCTLLSHHGRVLAIEHDVVCRQLRALAVVLHAIAAGFFGGLDHQADRACERHAAVLDRLHGVQRGGNRALVVNGAATV